MKEEYYRTTRDMLEKIIYSSVMYVISIIVMSIICFALCKSIINTVCSVHTWYAQYIQYIMYALGKELPEIISPGLLHSDLMYEYPTFANYVKWSVIAACIVAFAPTYLMLKTVGQGLLKEEHVRGRYLSEDTQEAVKELKNEVGTPGVYIHPNIQITSDRETKHILIVGGVGAGKTQIIWPILQQIEKDKQAKCIIHDVKGDFAANIKTKKFLRFALWDNRSAYWDIAADVVDENTAREFAACFVAGNDNDPMWSNSARMIFVSLLMKLIKTKGRNWGWKDLSELLYLDDIEDLKIIIQQYYKPATVLINEKAEKTTQSILINIAAFAAPIHFTATIWGNGKGMKRFAINRFIDDDYDGDKILILQNNDNYREILTCMYPAFIRLMSGRMNGPAMPDSKTRKLWFVLDEFPQLGKLDNFGPILETGRSKGLRAILCCQDITQLQDLYNKEKAAGWAGLIGTWIIGKISNTETQEFFTKTIGKKLVKKLNISTSRETFGVQDEDTSEGVSYNEKEEDAFPAADFNRKLLVNDSGITALLFLSGTENGLYRLKWPFAKVSKQRPVLVPHPVCMQGMQGETAEEEITPESTKKLLLSLTAKRSHQAREKTLPAGGNDNDRPQPPRRKKKKKQSGGVDAAVQEYSNISLEDIGEKIAVHAAEAVGTPAGVIEMIELADEILDTSRVAKAYSGEEEEDKHKGHEM